jgi:FkbH-like protein
MGRGYQSGVADTLGVSVETGQVLRPAEYHRLARTIAASSEPKHHVHILSSFSAQFLEPLLVVEAYRAGALLELTVGAFGQLEQELYAASPLHRPDNRVVVILLRPEDVDPDLFRSTGAVVARERLSQLEDRICSLVRSIRQHGHATVLVANAASPPSFEAGTPSPLAAAVHEFNARLPQQLANIPDAHLFDWAGVVADFGSLRFEDPRLWYLARVPCSQDAGIFVSQRLARRLASMLVPRAKCVVIDLDDTLWGGALGDEGVDGIKLGDDYPGSVFKDFQFRLKELTRRGILLAIASKNDESTVRDAFSRHPEMVLTWDDFSSHRISWEPKEQTIPQIARELNLGLDSLVFLDDNPVECAAVRSALPAVQVRCLGRDPLAFRSILADLPALDRSSLTREDEQRTTMYARDRQRREQEHRHQSRDEFLTSLSMTAEVGLCDALALPRVVQLIEKTNQFNLTSRRHTHDAVRGMLADEGARVATLRLRDVYGEMGLVCVAILLRSPGGAAEWRIDTFLMSCRVMGRGVEDAFLAYLVEEVRAAGGRRVIGEYCPTAKNGIVREFYSRHGFVATGEGGSAFALDLTKGAISWPAQIQRLA